MGGLFPCEGAIGRDKDGQSFFRGLPGPLPESSIRGPASVSLRMRICVPSLACTLAYDIRKRYKGVSKIRMASASVGDRRATKKEQWSTSPQI